MSAQLMGLVRELKALNAKKKAGESLTPEEEARRKELKVFLKSQLEGGDEGASGTVPRPSSSSSSSSQSQPSAPPPAAKPAPRPATMSAPPVAPPRPEPPRAPPPPPPSQPQAQPSKPAYTPKKDAFAIAGAASFIDAAMSSDAVAKVDPWAGRKAQASQGELEDAEARADAALRATKKRERATRPEEVEEQLRVIADEGSGYTPPADDFVLEQYYGDYFGEGMQPAVGNEAADLRPIDPRELEVRRAIDMASGPSMGATSAAVPAGLAFLDDFANLYAKRILPPPNEDISVEVEDPTLLIGKRKVTVHLINGEKKQGSIRALRRGELGFKLDVGTASEEIALAQVKAVFVHLQPNAQPKSGGGRAITVMFRDQRAVQGESADYAPNAPVFTLVPPAGRGQFEKIVVNAAAVASIS